MSLPETIACREERERGDRADAADHEARQERNRIRGDMGAASRDLQRARSDALNNRRLGCDPDVARLVQLEQALARLGVELDAAEANVVGRRETTRLLRGRLRSAHERLLRAIATAKGEDLREALAESAETKRALRFR